MGDQPQITNNADNIAREIVERTKGEIRLALPLGLGKANTIANALTALALEDPSIDLDIFTALTLERPEPDSLIQARFLDPAMDRLFGKYTALDYARHLRAGTLPGNITVKEFFFQAGSWLGNVPAQAGYISANYTHALQFLMERKPNVIAQLLARDGGRFSLSCNTDITADLLRARDDGRQDFILAGEINPELPFMPGSGEIGAQEIDLLLDDPESQFELFSVPKRPVTLSDHAVGLHAAALIPDGGTLQIGIGSVGDAVASALILRHREPGVFRDICADAPFPFRADQTSPFKTGLYAVTEMLVQGIIQLLKAGIISREVNSALIDAGFFVDCRDFYRTLREMPEADRARIAMRAVSFTNDLYGKEDAKRAARKDARFVNSAMKATALGGIISDVTQTGQIVSGVGGQFNFVSQAFALDGARAIITLPATRESGGRVTSNIVWDHPHETIPRHMRDIVVTEYGVADLRGRSDADVILAMIGIAESRFQTRLMDEAKKAGKLPSGAVLPDRHRRNTPDKVRDWLRPFHEAGHLPSFPFGTDFSEVEQRLLPALAMLKGADGSKRRMAALLWAGLKAGQAESVNECLERMGLAQPETARERLYALVLRGAIKRSADNSPPV